MSITFGELFDLYFRHHSLTRTKRPGHVMRTYRKLGGQFPINRFDLQRILDCLETRGLVARLLDATSVHPRYAISTLPMSEATEST
jgi:hypothetical protein